MQPAINWAITGSKADGGGPFGAVIIKDGRIIAEGHNKVGADADCTQHAELRAIQQACAALETKDLSGCTLYTSCEPCMMCLGACYWAGFDAIYYGASAADARGYGFEYTAMYYASNVEKRYSEFNMSQLMREEALKVWEDYE